MENQKKHNWVLSASILIAAVLIAGSLIYSAGLKDIGSLNGEQAETDGEPIAAGLQIGDDVVLGNPDAPVTMFIFGDYQCPFCVKFFKEAEASIRDDYVEAGKVKLVYKDLAFLGQESAAAAQAAECAKDQGKYWQYHDSLYEIEYKELQEGHNKNTGNLNRETFQGIASDLEMDAAEFLNCFDSEKYADEVENDIEEAKAVIGQRLSTPTIFINGQMIRGAQPHEVFAEIIEEALAE